MSANQQKTLDDIERILPKRHRIDKFKPISPKHIKNPRSRKALEVYDNLQASHLLEDDPLFS